MRGEFANQIDENTYEAVLEGFHSAETGSVYENGTWYGLVDHVGEYAGAIVSEDSQGFVHVDYFKTQQELVDTWLAIANEVEEWYAQS